MAAGLLAGAQAAPPQLGGSQVTVRLRLCSQRLLEVWNWQVPHAPQSPVRQTPFTGPSVVPPQLPTHCHPPLERVRFAPAEQPVVLHTPFTGPAVVPPQLPRHCHRPPERLYRRPAEQPVALHAPFTGGKAVQLALVGSPQVRS